MPTQAIRINVDSFLRDKGDQNTIEQYRATLGHPFRKIADVRLLGASVPKSMYQTGVAGRSLELPFEFGGTPHTATLPAQSYTSGVVLAQALATAMNAESGVSGVTGTFDSSTGKITLAASSTLEMAGISDTLAQLTGFDSTTATPANSITAENIIDLSWPRFLWLEVRLSDMDVVGDWTTQRLDEYPSAKYSFRIPLDVAFGDIKHYAEGSEYPQNEPPTRMRPDVDHIHVTWYYPDGKELESGAFNGAHHQMTFMFR